MAEKKRASAVCNYCFTLNNYSESDVECIQHFATECRGLIFGKEVAPTTGTKHLQGYFQLWRRERTTSLIKRLPKGIHLEAAKGTWVQNEVYCSKGGDYQKFGEFEIERGSCKTIRAKVNACNSYSEFLDLVDEIGSHHLRFAQECYYNKPLPKMENVILRDWQQYLFDKLQEVADDRTIYWVYDEKGNKGKTFFSKYMMCNHGAFYTSPAKGADILHCYKNEKIILYDIPRSCDEEYVNWGVIEKLKDGIVFSGKYNSCVKVRSENAHVCIFSNVLPEEGKFSEDRIKLIDLSKINEVLEEHKIVKVDEIQLPIQEPEVITAAIPDGDVERGFSPSPLTPVGGEGEKPRQSIKKIKKVRSKVNFDPFASDGEEIEKSDIAGVVLQNEAVSESITRNCGTTVPSTSVE